MDWGTAGVAIVVAALGIAGGYLVARWQARYGLEQWRRERLLEFCADLVAAGSKASGGGKTKWTFDEMNRLDHAIGCIRLLSEDLARPALNYQGAIFGVVRAVLNKESDLDAKSDAWLKAEAVFLQAANSVLLQPQAPWWQLWSRSKSKPKAKAV